MLRHLRGHSHPSWPISSPASPRICRAFPVQLPELCYSIACRNEEHRAETKLSFCCFFSTEEGKMQPHSCQDVQGCMGEHTASCSHDGHDCNFGTISTKVFSATNVLHYTFFFLIYLGACTGCLNYTRAQNTGISSMNMSLESKQGTSHGLQQ